MSARPRPPTDPATPDPSEPQFFERKEGQQEKDTKEERKISKGQVTGGLEGVRESYRDKVKTALGKMWQRRQEGGDMM